jgi:hypothetical protein
MLYFNIDFPFLSEISRKSLYLVIICKLTHSKDRNSKIKFYVKKSRIRIRKYHSGSVNCTYLGEVCAKGGGCPFQNLSLGVRGMSFVPRADALWEFPTCKKEELNNFTEGRVWSA